MVNKQTLFNFRELHEKDCLLLFHWANDIDVRKNAISTDPVEFQAHKEWFLGKLRDLNSKIYILEHDGEPVGQIRFDKENNYWKIDYSVDRRYRGLGLGKKIVELGIGKMTGTFKAWVKPENIASQKVFEKLNFIKRKDAGLYLYILTR